MAEPTPVAFDLTLFEDDGVTPWFGSADLDGEVIESDFQTPDPDLAHDRTYLLVPRPSQGAEIDFLSGSSSLASMTVGVVDFRTVAADQGTGIVTSRIRDAVGRRAVVRRLIAGDWVKVFDGVVHSYLETEDDLLTYHFHLRDTREFERGQPLFFSNHVVLGKDFKSGPAIDYGLLPHARVYFEEEGVQVSSNFLLNRVPPFESVNAGGIDHFALRSDPSPSSGIHFGFVGMGTFEGWPGVNLAELGDPVPDADGIYRYREVWVRWRAQGSDDEWTELRAMPRAEYKPLVEFPNVGRSGDIGGGNTTFFSTISLYLGSEDSADLPADGQEIELQVIAVRITENSPFWWDGGTLGDLLEEIVAGDHTTEPPKERYDATALAAFAIASPRARLIIRQPVSDRLRWIEENIYMPALVAPRGVDIEMASAEMPNNAATIPRIPSGIAVGWQVQHGTENIVGAVEFAYIREHLDPPELVYEMREERTLSEKVKNDVRRQLNDAAASEQPWRRLRETSVFVSSVATDPVPGARSLRYAPVTIRSIGSVDGKVSGGDVQDDTGVQVARRLFATIFPMYEKGARVFEVLLPATPQILAVKPGDIISIEVPIMANYNTGRRGA